MEYDGYKEMCERLKRTIDARNAELSTLRAENDRLRDALNLTLEHAHLYLPHLRPGFSVYDIAREALK
jgi:cell shape-determining protein MreC